VANSTVFGGVAGDTMAQWVQGRALLDYSAEQAQQAVAAADRPFRQAPGDLYALRERLAECMWNDAGIVRDKAGLERAADQLRSLHQELLTVGVADTERAYNLTWHDWLNLDSLLHVSQAIVHAAL